MASTILYPPTVESVTSAFVANGNGSICTLYYSLSKFSASSTIKSIHISVIKQSSGLSVVNKTDNVDTSNPEQSRYRSSGIIILNQAPQKVDNNTNLYKLEIKNEDIQIGDSNVGWQPGVIYKIQLRVSSVKYDGSTGQAAWLVANGGNFSEWSTYTVTKAIGAHHITFDFLDDYNSATEKEDLVRSYSISTLHLFGKKVDDTSDTTEALYSYNAILNDANDNLIEESGLQYTNGYTDINQFDYTFKHELDDATEYHIVLKYTTVNKYEDEAKVKLLISRLSSDTTTIKAITLDMLSTISDEDFVESFNDSTSYDFEEDTGRIAVKFYSTNTNHYNGNICLRRAESTDNFQTWTDIKIVNCVNKVINNLDIIWDNTCESGVWYKYAVELISTTGERGIANISNTLSIRQFNYSYLIGEDGVQLCLKFNNTMGSYAYTYSESKTDTIGGKFPFITRNGNMKYRTFPLGGLISYYIDEDNLFTSDLELYKYSDIISKYQLRRTEENFGVYDYKREFDFREKVLAFLQDGKPKLFKSSTEGNIIIRIMQVTAQPNQSLNRMLASFTATAYEIADATMDNYQKYNFYDPGEYASSFEAYSVHLGQLDMDLTVGDNIIDKIWEKYDLSDYDSAGSRITLQNVHNLTLEFTSDPMPVYNNANEAVLGNNFFYNGNLITLKSDFQRSYYFDDNITFLSNSQLTVGGGINDEKDSTGKDITTVHVVVDFVYELSEEPYVAKQVSTRTSNKGTSQIFGNYAPGTNLYKELYYKFYYEWQYNFRRLNQITWTCIEAVPNAIFQIQDGVDDTGEIFDINYTGVLNLENLGLIQNLKYIGMRNSDGSIDTETNCDILIDYIYYTSEGTYVGGTS